MSNNAAQDSNEKKAQVQEYYSRTAESYVTSVSHSKGRDLPRLVELGEWEPHHQALDIATGGGHTAFTIAPHVAQVTVTDLTPTMLEKAQAFLLAQGITNAHFKVADAEALPFPDASFDRVTCRIAPHHFPNVGKAVQEVARVLKPGGLFLLIDNIAPGKPELDTFINKVEKWRDPSHARSYTQEEWQGFFAQAGLHIEFTERFRKTLEFEDWTRRSQLPEQKKAALEAYILNRAPQIRQHFAVGVQKDGQVAHFTIDVLLLKGRKK